MLQPKRYHPTLVTIHWLSALLIIMNLAFGLAVLINIPNDATKFMPLANHMTFGLIVLVLTVARIIVRATTPQPAPATSGNPYLDKLAILVHVLLYAGALGMGLSGLGIAFASGIMPLLAGQPVSLPQGPEGFYIYPPRMGHDLVSYLLYLVIAMHVGAALFHQFIRRDNLLSRMWFGKR